MAPRLQSSMLTSSRPLSLSSPRCPVQAQQVEMEFKSATSEQFSLIITAPNGEQSQPLSFCKMGTMHKFTPANRGCGHGLWRIEVHQQTDIRSKIVYAEAIPLDGVGSLCFSIGNDFTPKIENRLWLRLPSGGCCPI